VIDKADVETGPRVSISEISVAIDRLMPELERVSTAIHARPELCFEEFFASETLADVLESNGIRVQRAAYGTDTGFAAEFGASSGPTVALLLEYDALPSIGHGCGHNVIASAGLGASLALVPIANDLGLKVRVLGTPAEEGGGGKIKMGRNGAFSGVDAALMIHPADRDLLKMNAIAIQELRAVYRGKAAHAASSPHEGRNALDAAVLGYNAVAALRQHIRDSERVHGIFVHGGEKPNVVPAYAETLWYVRSDTLATLAPLRERVASALLGGAQACGCDVELHWEEFAYAEMLDNQPLLGRYAELARELGREPVMPSPDARVVGSTDMGNVSHLVPSIHPMVAIAPPGTPLHTEDFAAAAVGESATAGIRDGAILLANLACDLVRQGDLLKRARESGPSTGDATGVLFD